MTENDRRYSRNRNKWRKTYPFAQRPPRQEAIANPVTEVTTSFDLNRIYKHEDHFVIKGGDTGFLVYFEGLAHFHHETEVEVLLGNECLIQNSPIVTYTLETNNSQSNVNVFGILKPDTRKMLISTSAPFTGSVRYRGVATRDIDATTFPMFITADLTCPGTPSSSFWIYAGSAELDSTRTRFTCSYTIPSGSLEFRLEAHNTTKVKESDVHFTVDTITTSSATGTISAPLNDNIHFQITSQ